MPAFDFLADDQSDASHTSGLRLLRGENNRKCAAKNGETGEDDVRRAEKELEETTHKYIHQVDELLAHKEAELLEV